MSEFIYPVTVLSQDKAYLFRELKHKQYKALTKVILDDDKPAFELFIDSLIDELSADDLDTGTLNVVDKFYILMVVRARCISPEITFVSEVDAPDDMKEDKIKIKIPISINDLLQRIGEFDLQYTFQYTDKRITVNGSLPKRFYFSDIFAVAAECVDTSEFGDNVTK